MHRQKCFSLILIVLCMLAACELPRKRTEPPVKSPPSKPSSTNQTSNPSALPVQKATEIAEVPTEAPSPTTSPTLEPKPSLEPTPGGLEKAVIGFSASTDRSPGFVLYYDPSVWQAAPNEASPKVSVLNHKKVQGCSLQQLLGRGFDGTKLAWTTDEWLAFNGISIRYKVLSQIADNTPILAGYYWDDDKNTLEVSVDKTPFDCLTAAQEVVKISADNEFK